MAQHIETKHFKQKRFREIEKGIINTFNKGLFYVRSSLMFEELDYKEYKEHENDIIFNANRSIPKGIVLNDTRGSFEIHYNKRTKKVTKIYLVA